MMRRALYGRVLLLWGWAFGSQHYIDIGIDVNVDIDVDKQS